MIQKGGFIVPLLTSILSGVIGALINNSKEWHLQRMILVPPEMWETRSRASPPPPVKTILNGTDHSYKKWMKVRLHQDPFLKSEKQKREPISIPILETKVTHPDFKTKPKRERITGSLPWFKREALDSESETDSLPIHSEYINEVLKRKVSHDRTFVCIKTKLTAQ